MKLSPLATLLIALTAASQSAQAALAEARFTAEVYWASDAGLADVGSTVTGTFRFDDAVASAPANQFCPADTCAGYRFSNPYGFTLALGDAQWVSSDFFLQVTKHLSTQRDSVLVLAESGTLDFSLEMWGPLGSHGEATPPSLSALDALIPYQGPGRFTVTTGPFRAELLATVTGFSVSPVPEPSTLALFGIGLLGVAFGARKRQAAASRTA